MHVCFFLSLCEVLEKIVRCKYVNTENKRFRLKKRKTNVVLNLLPLIPSHFLEMQCKWMALRGSRSPFVRLGLPARRVAVLSCRPLVSEKEKKIKEMVPWFFSPEEHPVVFRFSVDNFRLLLLQVDFLRC